MRVFLDTNVWLSARFRPGLCAELLEGLVESGAEILLDERVLDEFRRIARDKLKVDAALLERSELFFRLYAVIAPAASQPTPGIPDPDDGWIVAAALACGVDIFVTGDQALLDVGRATHMPILSPRQAYRQLRGLA
jgi:putative PIN family toxin of toxin-antitoxin system